MLRTEHPEPECVEDLTDPLIAALESDDWNGAITAAKGIITFARRQATAAMLPDYKVASNLSPHERGHGVPAARSAGINDPLAREEGEFFVVRIWCKYAKAHMIEHACGQVPDGAELIEIVSRRGRGWYVGNQLVGRSQD
jgi:hypothetical protein